jgi:hypothetical protein
MFLRASKVQDGRNDDDYNVGGGNHDHDCDEEICDIKCMSCPSHFTICFIYLRGFNFEKSHVAKVCYAHFRI